MLSLSDIVNVKVGIGKGVFEAPGATVIGGNTSTFSQQILKLFANNEQGFFYDPNDLSSMYQDAAGTIPVTAAEQPVGLMRDKSGNNNHAFATSSATRPILQRNATAGAYYLEFDGADDFLQTNNIDFTMTDKVSLFAGVRKLSDAALGTIASFQSTSGDLNGAFSIRAPSGNGLPTYGGSLVGLSTRDFVATGYTAPGSAVISAMFSVNSASVTGAIKIRMMALSQVLTGGGVWTPCPNFGSHPLYIGRRGGTSAPFSGHLYSLICTGRLTTDSETIELEKALAKNTGVTLNV